MADDLEKLARRRRLRHRNLALMAVLICLMVLFYLVTVVRLGGGPAG